MDLLLYSGLDFVDNETQRDERQKLVNNHILRFFFDIEKNKQYRGMDLLKHIRSDYLAFAWGCQIRLSKLGKMRFYEGIMAEDALFAPILLYKMSNVAFFDDCFYKRRIRALSITDFGNQHTINTLSSHLGRICSSISNDQDVKNYYLAYSCACICGELHKYFFVDRKNEKIEADVLKKIKELIASRVPMAFYGLHFESDPMNIRKKLLDLRGYIKYIRVGSKVAYFFPNLYRFLKRIKK